MWDIQGKNFMYGDLASSILNGNVDQQQKLFVFYQYMCT